MGKALVTDGRDRWYGNDMSSNDASSQGRVENKK